MQCNSFLTVISGRMSGKLKSEKHLAPKQQACPEPQGEGPSGGSRSRWGAAVGGGRFLAHTSQCVCKADTVMSKVVQTGMRAEKWLKRETRTGTLHIEELWEIQTRQFRKDMLHNIYKKYFKLLLKRTSSVQILCNTFSVYTDKFFKKLNSINLLNI